MTDSDQELHQRPLPDVERDTPEIEEEKKANRLAVGFAIFIPIGIVLGLNVLDNVGIGVAIGLAMAGIYGLAMNRFVVQSRP